MAGEWRGVAGEWRGSGGGVAGEWQGSSEERGPGYLHLEMKH